MNNKEEGKIRNDKEGMVHHHTQQSHEKGAVPLKDVTVMSDYNKMETPPTTTTTATTDDGNDEKSTTHGSTPRVVGSTREPQQDSQYRHYDPQQKQQEQRQQQHQTHQRQQQKGNKNLILPTKGTIYRQMHNSVISHPRIYEIPTPEQLIAWQFSLSADDDDHTNN